MVLCLTVILFYRLCIVLQMHVLFVEIYLFLLSGNLFTFLNTAHLCLSVFIIAFIQVIRRYEKEFGTRNYQFTVGKVNFIAIDAQTLDGKHGSG